ncbi:MAG: carboxypeptidase-like regulatory domain-containing protein [Candidatus Limnocylindrales bacterium]
MDSSAQTPAARRTAAAALVALMAFSLALAACTPGASPSLAPAGTSTLATGVRGIVLAGPTCPVERPNESACVRPVSGATVLALDSAGGEAGRAVSDSTGAYFLRLPPGSYEIVPQAVPGLMGVAPATAVTVTAGAPLQLDLQYDTGIR